MSREDEIRRVLAEILRQGLLMIRGWGFQGDAEACHIEADHLHNLPPLIANFHEGLFTYYCDAERPGYVNSGGDPKTYAELWQRLDELRAANEFD